MSVLDALRLQRGVTVAVRPFSVRTSRSAFHDAERDANRYHDTVMWYPGFGIVPLFGSLTSTKK